MTAVGGGEINLEARDPLGVPDYSTFHECLLDHKLSRLAVIAFDKTLAEQQRPRVVNQRRTATDHDAIMFGRKRSKIGVAEQLA